MASLRQWETMQAKVKELFNLEPSSCDIRLVHKMAGLCLQVAEDRDYQPSVSDWSKLIKTLQASVVCAAQAPDISSAAATIAACVSVDCKCRLKTPAPAFVLMSYLNVQVFGP
jgi:hypothetical protein